MSNEDSSTMLTPEQIQQNFTKFRKLCETKLGDRSAVVVKMIDSMEDQLALCPASGKKGYHGAFPGGLVDHSLRVLANARKLVQAYGWDVPIESLIMSCLFHDIGKVGIVMDDNKVVDYYVGAEQWRKDKLGELYTYNASMPYLTTQHRSMHVLQHFNVQLTYEEFTAILLNDGFVVDDNKPYCLKIPQLAFAVMTADYISTMEEKRVAYWPHS